MKTLSARRARDRGTCDWRRHPADDLMFDDRYTLRQAPREPLGRVRFLRATTGADLRSGRRHVPRTRARRRRAHRRRGPRRTPATQRRARPGAHPRPAGSPTSAEQHRGRPDADLRATARAPSSTRAPAGRRADPQSNGWRAPAASPTNAEQHRGRPDADLRATARAPSNTAVTAEGAAHALDAKRVVPRRSRRRRRPARKRSQALVSR